MTNLKKLISLSYYHDVCKYLRARGVDINQNLPLKSSIIKAIANNRLALAGEIASSYLETGVQTR
jgi:hypothetical protein